MNDQHHQRRIERWLRTGVAIIVPVTILIGGWLLLYRQKPTPPPPPLDGSAHVFAFPAAPGPPAVTLSPAPAKDPPKTPSKP